MSGQNFLFLAIAFLAVTFAGGGLANADVLKVGISAPGGESFLEGTTRSGQIVWSVDEPLVIPASNMDIYLRFAVTISFTDADNVPVDPWLSDLRLIDWPPGFESTLPWSFVWFSSSLDGPRNTWDWSATVTVEPGPGMTFPAGQDIATAAWSTGGDDVDNVFDDSPFEMAAYVSERVWVGGVYIGPDGQIIHGMYALSKSASDVKFFNPEPIPAPPALTLLALGALTVAGGRRQRG